jgi:hypothetical protein
MRSAPRQAAFILRAHLRCRALAGVSGLLEAGEQSKRLDRPLERPAQTCHNAPVQRSVLPPRRRSLISVLLLPLAAGIALIGAAIALIGMHPPVVPRGIGKACAADQGRCNHDRAEDLLHGVSPVSQINAPVGWNAHTASRRTQQDRFRDTDQLCEKSHKNLNSDLQSGSDLCSLDDLRDIVALSFGALGGVDACCCPR